jgi:hypothetical protein
VAAGERHDSVGSHRYIALSAQIGDNFGASVASDPGPSPHDPHCLAVEFERDPRVGRQTRPFADIGRNG